MDDREKRLNILARVPRLARMDHRFFLNEQGKDVRVEALPRKDRRRLKVAGQRITRIYIDVLTSISKSGPGYEADKILRQLAIEYTHRYESSGVYNQPTSFNYFEPFCDIKLISGTNAPYAMPAQEVDNLFGLSDFIDFLTTPETPDPEARILQELDDGVVHHYNVAGAVTDFTFLSPAGREFVVASFSIVRRGGSLHWYMVAGELLSDEDWEDEEKRGAVLETDAEVTPHKALFIADASKHSGNTAGPPLCLSGVQKARKTVASGEMELGSMNHISRCLSIEHENIFMSITDDPAIFSHVQNRYERLDRQFKMNERIAQAAAVWALAEAMLQLPKYFAHRLAVPKAAATMGRRRAPNLSPKAAHGDGERFQYVPSIALIDGNKPVIRQLDVPYYKLETEGYWQHLERSEFGRDRHGGKIQGKTWISEDIDWRSRSVEEKTIYIKSSVAQARLRSDEFLKGMTLLKDTDSESRPDGVVYVLRCLTMRDEVYKVGWTSGTAEDRARELSAATGVPTSFTVVGSWVHKLPAALEAGVHARLAPYRLSDQREFFQVSYGVIRDAIEREIERSTP